MILPGAGTVGLDYLDVAHKAAAFTTSVVYDRAGTGWSEPMDLPRSSTQVTDELRALLSVMGVAPPYVLVGHSLGGLYSRHYATRFPEEVAGLVLLDPTHEDYNAYMPPELRERAASQDGTDVEDRTRVADLIPDALPPEFIAFYRRLFAAEMPGWPEQIKAPLIEAHVNPAWVRTGVLEASNLDTLHEEVAAAGSLPDVPVVILVSTGLDDFRRAVCIGQSEQQLKAEIDARRRLYEAVVAKLPHARLHAVPDAGHATLPFRRPEAVVQAIREVVGLPSPPA
ncbi:MAG TPA: alpha/beta hydrolase [Solirubrobacteraceae bacterium]|nr:alpha/beta hydrolase [Solirubrobacteraceae bacterium]